MLKQQKKGYATRSVVIMFKRHESAKQKHVAYPQARGTTTLATHFLFIFTLST